MVMTHVAIRGRVQGVGYRAWTADEARRRDLEGWVRNRRDGSVEAVFCGAEGVITDMLTACRRGPSSARVDAMDASPAGDDMLNLRAAGDRFSLLPTL
ncbi:MAG: acylphosphatase [Xanthobacteraceae bacterium]